MKLRNIIVAMSMAMLTTVASAETVFSKALLLPATLISAAISVDSDQLQLGERAKVFSWGVTSSAIYVVPGLNVTSTSANMVLIELSGIRKVRVAEQLVNEIEDYQFTGEASQILSETLALNEVTKENEEAFLNNLNEELIEFLENN